MTRSMRAALIAFAVALAVLPALAIHALLLHVDEQGEMEWQRGLTDPGFLGLLAIAGLALLLALPLVSLIRSGLDARAIARTFNARAERRETYGVEYSVIDVPEFFIVTLGLWRPTIFMSSAAETSLGGGKLHAALLHEQAHRLRKDTLWRWTLLSLTQPIRWLPGVAGLRRGSVLRSECQADDDALSHGASRHALFEAMVVAAGAGHVPTAAALADRAIEYRLMRLATRDSALPRDSVGKLAVLTVAVASLPVTAHLLVALGMVCVA